MHFVMHAFSNHVGILHNVTSIDPPAQSAVLSDGVVALYLHKNTPCRGGGFIYPPKRVVSVRTIHSFISFKRNHDLVAQSR